MEINFLTAIKGEKEYIVFERSEFKKLIEVIRQLNKVITESIETYLSQIEFIMDEKLDAKSKAQTQKATSDSRQ